MATSEFAYTTPNDAATSVYELYEQEMKFTGTSFVQLAVLDTSYCGTGSYKS